MRERGIVGLLNPAPAGYQEVPRFEIRESVLQTWTPLVIVGAKLFLRDQVTLYGHTIWKP